jgi:eukaryotic-like serine/threonine-protein kinase
VRLILDSAPIQEQQPATRLVNDWQRVQQVFLEVVDLRPPDRVLALEHICAGDSDLRTEVQSLLDADDGSGLSIELAVQDEAASLLDEPALIGQRIGMYLIVSELGRGGMGTVYLALRDDAEFEHRVALKIVKRGMDTADVLARFRYERQILAGLEHPYIARLFDGGSTVDGVPFFVMEYIEGKPVHHFCRDNNLNYRQRCELFLLILDAVAYAHRSLVVHRDLKPANVLINVAGVPKLLDFGVASLLGPRPDGDSTRLDAMRPYTPGYASPEQVQGLPLTTATDIYSLGAILYELLVGKQAHTIMSHTPAEIIRVVCEEETSRPSKEARDLPPELDDIVLMAMRKEPERRYGSAVEFADDLRRFLEGRPVAARQDSFVYRVRKFLWRNRLESGLVAAMSLSLIAGLFISIAQTRRAERAQRAAEYQRIVAQRESAAAGTAQLAESQQRAVAESERQLASHQRDLAEQQRAVAELRAKDIVEFAGKALFDVHDAIAELPGSIDARRTLVKTALEYLENVEKQQGMDNQMREALAAGYYKVAMIQGDPFGASLQDFDASEASLRQGEKILLPAYSRHPEKPDLMIRLIEIRSSLARLEFRSGREQQAIQHYIALIAVAHRLAAVKDCPLLCKTQEPVLENDLATHLLTTETAVALEHAERGIALDRALLNQNPGNFVLEQGLGSVTAAAAGALRNMGELEKAGQYYRESIAARERLLEAHSTNLALRRNLMIAYGNYEVLLGIPWSANLNRPAEARVYGEKSVALARQMVKDDPNDVTARRDLGMSLSRLGMVDPVQDGLAQSLATLRESRALIEPIARANPHSAEAAGQIALITEYEGHRLEALGDKAAAMASYRQSIDNLRPFLEKPTSSVMSQYLADVENLNRLNIDASQSGAAVELAGEALTRVERYSDHTPRSDGEMVFLGKAWAILSMAQSGAGRGEEAKDSATKAVDLWNGVKPGLLAQNRELMETMRRVAAAQHQPPR